MGAAKNPPGPVIPGLVKQTSVLVAPFANETGDPDNDYIADGFAEDLTVSLAHIRQFPVIDHNTAFALRRSEQPPLQFARTLGAGYLIDGALRTRGTRLRFVTRLVDVQTSHALWDEEHEIDYPGGLDAVENAVAKLVGTLEGRLEEVEAMKARGLRASRADTKALVWRARWHMKRLTREDSAEARRLLELAVAEDPADSEALIQLAWWHWLDVWTSRAPKARILEFKAHASRALNSNPVDSRGYLLMGVSEIFLRNIDAARVHLQDAVTLNPSSAQAHLEIGTCHMLTGEAREALAPLAVALRLNPRDYFVFNVYAEIACSYCMASDWDLAIRCARQALALRPSYWFARMVEINALARSGRPDEAADAFADIVARKPDFSEAYVRWVPFTDEKWTQFFIDGLRLARSHLESRAGQAGGAKPDAFCKA